jgi:hypothetical protein
MKSAASAKSLAAPLLVAMLVLAGECRKAREAQSAEDTAQQATAPLLVASSSDLLGVWTVVGHHVPGISAMSDADAAAWHGGTVRLTATVAVSPGNHCAEPTYATRTVARDRLLATEFNLPPGSLTAMASLEDITLLEVSCGGVRWAAMGGLLLGIDADHALTPWDGVFFELARDRDFRAVGQEPFWHLEIIKGIEMRFTYAVGERKAVTPVPAPKTSPRSGAQTYHAITEANDLRVVIESSPCTDVMSGKPFPAAVTVTLNGRTYDGCGGPLE